MKLGKTRAEQKLDESSPLPATWFRVVQHALIVVVVIIS